MALLGAGYFLSFGIFRQLSTKNASKPFLFFKIKTTVVEYLYSWHPLFL